MEDPKGRPTPPFDQIEPGTELGEFSYELTRDYADRHLRATEQERYSDAGLAPVSLLAADGVLLADRFWDISQSVHAGQRLEVVRIPRVGDRLTVRGAAREKFVKKGRRYVVSDITTTDGRGELVARGVTTGVLVYAEGESGEERREESPRPAGAPVLETLGPLVRTMTLEKMRLYEPPGEKNIHTDDDLARAAGLPAAIATGTQFLAYVFDLLYRTYGIDSVVGTELNARIRLPVFAGDSIETSADVVSREGSRVEHTVRCRGPHGDVIVGSARVPAK
jgi:acyl dehydratase